jgi:hypothetical protein
MLSGIRDIDREIIGKLDDRELLKVCSIDKYTWNTVCDDDFLKRRLLSKYPIIDSNKGTESWKQFFLKAIYYIDKLKEEFNYEYTYGNFVKQYNILEKIYEEQLYDIIGIMKNLLVQSVLQNEMALVEFCLKYKKYYNYDLLMKTLFAAIDKNNYEIFAYLLKKIKLKNNLGLQRYKYLLRRVLKSEHLDAIKLLIEKLIKTFSYNEVLNFLSLTLTNGDFKTIKYLLDLGVNRDIDEALLRASESGNTDVVKYLVEHGEHGVKNYNLALLAAVESNKLEIVKYLVENGADIHFENDRAIKIAKDREVINYLISRGSKRGLFTKIRQKLIQGRN